MTNASSVGILGLAAAIPSRKITNQMLSKQLGVAPDWIEKRTGIQCRYFVSKTESAISLAAKAAKKVLLQTKIDRSQIGLILCGTTSGNYVFPSVACRIQHLLNVPEAAAFDLSASATSFQTALSVARDWLRNSNSKKYALISTVAVQSPAINWKVPEIAVLLGDAAAAAVVAPVPAGYGILASEIRSHGELFDAATLRRGGSIEMDGVALGRVFLKIQPSLLLETLAKAGIRLKDVNLFIFHQANLRLIQLFMQKWNLPMSKTYTNVERYGNTAEASVPLALTEAAKKGRIKKGDIVVLSSMGAGCTLSVTILKWHSLK